MGQKYCKVSNKTPDALLIETFDVSDKAGEFPKRTFEAKPGETVKVKGLRLRITGSLRCEPLRTASHKQEIVIDRIRPEKDPSSPGQELEVPEMDKSSLDCERAATWPLALPQQQQEEERKESWLDHRDKYDELGYLLYKLREPKDQVGEQEARARVASSEDGWDGQPEEELARREQAVLRLMESAPVNLGESGDSVTMAWKESNRSFNRECYAY